MERSLISWNLPNWITIVLMAAFGYALVGFVSQLLKGQSLTGAVSSAGGF